jgi:histidine ammonia-lyase
MEFNWGVDSLTVQKALLLAEDPEKAVLSEDTIDGLRTNRHFVEEMLAKDRAYYGINTGFGPLCDTQVSLSETSRLQKNLLLTHAVGVGPAISPALTRLMLVGKIHSLCKGYSGVRPVLLRRLLDHLESNLIPVVPSQGSVGASGDLASLAHLFLHLIGEGELWSGDQAMPAGQVLANAGWEPLQLEAKEGLALINGTQFILAHALSGLDRFAYLLDLADLAGVMSLEGYRGSASPFSEFLHTVRPFPGNQQVAHHIRRLLKGSENLKVHEDCARVQDPYSLRCMAQVHGASRTAYAHLKELAEIEANSVTDNPVVEGEGRIHSGGNFHGQPLALAIDYTTLAVSELGNISDRRSYLLLKGEYGLPRFLVEQSGLNSGMMILQYTSAALVSENKSLCYPPSADSVPTSIGQEDHVSMGSISGRRFLQVLDNLEKILAVELLLSAQALEFRRPHPCSDIVEENRELIRKQVPKLESDRLLKPDLDAVIRLVEQRKFRVDD